MLGVFHILNIAQEKIYFNGLMMLYLNLEIFLDAELNSVS
jgi:hypothetical protein